MNRASLVGVALSFWIVVGCGTGALTDFPNRLIGAGGSAILMEDLRSVAADPNLSDDEKRQSFRELGIEDEKLIEALLAL